MPLPPAPCGKADTCEHCPYPDCRYDGLSAMEYKASYSADADARHSNMDKRADQRRAWYEANREKIADQRRAYYEANREKIADRQRAWYEANREKIADQQRAYREANREKYNAYHREYYRRKKEQRNERKNQAEHPGG